MNASNEPAAVALDLELDGYVADFEAALFRDAGADIASFLPSSNHPRYLDILGELVRVDLELTWERGDERMLEHYRESFPLLFRDPERLRALAQEERRLRVASGEKADASEYRRRFGIELSRSRIEHVHTRSTCILALDDDRGEFELTTDRMPEIGASVCGFRIDAELGRGAFGRVFLARQAELANRRVAVKISSKFPGEAKVLARLQHANIVPVYSVHRLGRFHVVCMPYLGSATLVDWLREYRAAPATPTTGRALASTLVEQSARTVKNSPDASAPVDQSPDPIAHFPPSIAAMYAKSTYVELVLWLISELADGLAHAHERGILHRDLKPANVLLTDDGRPMLLDFNLAAASASTDEQFVTVGGTVRYMAPEQLATMLGAATPIDARADVYALGLIMCELLTGDLPFADPKGDRHNALAQMFLDRSSELPRIQRPELSPAVVSIISTALDPDPNSRYPTAAALRDDLRQQLAHQPLRFARDSSIRERLSKWTRRHPRLSSGATLGALALTLIVAIVVGFTIRQSRLGRLEAENHLSQLKTARAEVHAMLVDRNGPRNENRQAAQRAVDALTLASSSAHRVRLLTDAEQREWRETVAEIQYFRARAEWLSSRRATETERQSLLNAAWSAHESAWMGWEEDRRPVMLIGQRIALLRDRGFANEAAQLERGNSLGDIDSRSAARIQLRNLDDAARTEAANASYWLVRGRVHALAGEVAAARGCYRVAGRLDSSSPWPHYHDGIACLETKDFGSAEAAFDRVIERDATISEAHFNRAIARVEQRKFAGAIEDLNRIENDAARLPRLYFVREIAYRALGNNKQADHDRDAGLKLTPTDAAGWNARGEARLRTTPPNHEGALSDFRRSVEVEPDFRAGYENQAQVLSEHMGKPREAIAALDQAVERFPDYALARSSRAVLWARLGKKDTARADAEEALRIDAAPLHCYQAACVYLLTGDRARALTLLRRALRADPSWAKYMPTDPDLKELRQSDAFAALLRAAMEMTKDD